jgi:hypothetical protein
MPPVQAMFVQVQLSGCMHIHWFSNITRVVASGGFSFDQQCLYQALSSHLLAACYVVTYKL